MLQEITALNSQENSSISLETQKQLSLKISTKDLIKIVEKASTFSERLSKEFIPKELEVGELEKEQKIIDSRLKRWCQVAAKDDREKFLKRLNWDNLDLNSIRPVLGSVILVNRESLPPWTDTLKKAMEIAPTILENIFDRHRLENYQYLDPENPLPFEEIILPFIEVGNQKLAQKIDSNYHILSDEAHLQLQSSLLRYLINLFAKTLDLEFSLFRTYHGSQLVHLINKLQNNPSTQLYKKFVQHLLQDGLLTFFQEYSVLGRLAAIATDFWVETTAEFLHRLTSDWDRIGQNFAPQEELGQVVDIQTGLSDFHNCGRSVIIIEFSSNLKLVYKPKSLALEQTYFDFLTWINQQNTVLPLKTLNIINCSTHSWIEFVETLPCQNQDAVKRYYCRAGMILCLIYALKGTDCHSENLIACGEQPILVDLETLLHHQLWGQEENSEANLIANEKIQNSVNATILLPGTSVEYQEKFFDISGLGNNNEELSVKLLQWENINTDSMMLVEEEAKILSKKNQPFGEDLDTSISNHFEEFITGFKEMYAFLRERKELLLAPDSPITAFIHKKVRVVLRNTQIYGSILQNSLIPKCLRSGVERSTELDVLSINFLSSEDKPVNWEMVAAEKKALEQLDIPYVTAYSDEDTMTINSEVTIDNFLTNPSYDDIINRLQQFNDVNLAEQISIIQASFYSCSPRKPKDVVVNLDKVVPFSREKTLQQAINIAEELDSKAIRGSNNSIAWLGMTDQYQTQRFRLLPLNDSLHDGNCGVALFLAALAKITGRAKYADIALGSLYSLRQIIQLQDKEIQTKLTKKIGVRHTPGLAPIVYTLVRIASFLDETKLIEEAEQIADWMKPEKMTMGEKPGLFQGTAGTILSLLALYKVTEKTEIIEQATVWGNYLLEQRVNSDGEYQIWTNSQQEPLIGFSHGIAGIAYALIQLYEVTQDSNFLVAAQNAIVYEQNYLSQENSSTEEDILFSLTSWCHGLPGIALARLGNLNSLDTCKIRQELKTILQSIKQPGIKELDNLCCGNFAEFEVLLLAADKLNDSKYLEISHQKLSQVLSRRDRCGVFQLLPNLPRELFVPSFSQGIAGVGYGLLKFIYPEKLPSILLWQ